jgi:uncharacterized protein
MMCLICKKSMILLEYHDVEVDYCPDCGGVWLDEGELEQILGDRTAAMNVLNKPGGSKSERKCLRCGQKMRTVSVTGGPEVDVCPGACGVWFDQGELRALARVSLPDEAGAKVVHVLSEMFGQEESANKGA